MRRSWVWPSKIGCMRPRPDGAATGGMGWWDFLTGSRCMYTLGPYPKFGGRWQNLHLYIRWWFPNILLFSTILGEMESNLTNTFQMGWFQPPTSYSTVIHLPSIHWSYGKKSFPHGDACNKLPFNISLTIRVWYIYLHLPYFTIKNNQM